MDPPNYSEQNTSTIKDNVSIHDNQPEQSENNAEVPTDFHEYSNNLKLVFEDLNKRLLKNPTVYAEPVRKFIENYAKCKTESSITSALHTFGKYNGMPLIKKVKICREEGLLVFNQLLLVEEK